MYLCRVSSGTVKKQKNYFCQNVKKVSGNAAKNNASKILCL